MAYEMRDNTFDFTFDPNSIDAKFPAVKMKLKVNGNVHEFGMWIRNGKYGRSYSCNNAQAFAAIVHYFLSGKAPAAAAPQQQEQGAQPRQQQTQQPMPSNVQNMQNYGRQQIKDDADNW